MGPLGQLGQELKRPEGGRRPLAASDIGVAHGRKTVRAPRFPPGVAGGFMLRCALDAGLSMARIDRLQPVKEIAQMAACIGRSFDLGDRLSAVVLCWLVLLRVLFQT